MMSISDGHIECVEDNQEETESEVQTQPVDIEVDSSLVSMSEVNEGEEIAIPVIISDNCGFTSTMFFVSFDSRLDFIRCESGIITTTTEQTSSGSETGDLTSGLAVASATANTIKKNGILFTLYFKLPEDTSVGDIFNIGIDKSMLCNSLGTNLKYTVTNGSITITDQYNVPTYTTTQAVTTTTTTTSLNIQTKPRETKTEINAVSLSDVLIYNDETSEKVKVPIYIENNEGFSSCGFTVSYDSRLTLSANDIKLSTSINGNLISFTDAENSTATIIIATSNVSKEDGVICWLYFDVPQSAEVGNEFDVEISNVSSWQRLNAKGDPGYSVDKATYTNLDVSTFAGSITVIERPVVTTVITSTTPKITTTTTTELEIETIPLKTPTASSKNIITIKNCYETIESAGKKVSVPIYISKNQGFSSNGVVIDYDPRLKITTSDISTSSYLNAGVSSFVYEPLHIISIATAGQDNTTGDIALYWLEFTLPSNVKAGDSFNIKFSEIYSWERIIEPNESGYEEGYVKVKTLDISVMNGVISIESDANTAEKKNEQANDKNIAGLDEKTTSGYLLGDANLNGKVDSNDAVKILREYAMSIINKNYTFDLNSNADVNFDGKYNSTDAVFILQYYASVIIGYKEKMDPFMESKGYTKK
jgi:hypothetical protein